MENNVPSHSHGPNTALWVMICLVICVVHVCRDHSTEVDKWYEKNIDSIADEWSGKYIDSLFTDDEGEVKREDDNRN